MKRGLLRLPALEVRQGPRRRLYSFAIDGKLVPKFATVSRIKRAPQGVLQGYQRPEVLAHIAEIRTFLEGEDPMVPNAVVLAFDSRVRFEPAREAFTAEGGSRPGTLVIPVDERLPDSEKPGFIVDGQQRLAAVRDADIDAFPLFVTAFISDQLEEQTEQFILVNSTKPLSKGLIYELLPNTRTRLSFKLGRKRFPAELLDLLNRTKGSPLEGLIQTTTNPNGIIKDNSILRMLDNSLTQGVLFNYRDPESEGGDVDSMLATLCAYWGAVKEVFSDAWGKPPKKSRLMHGAGIVSMGLLMDAIAGRHEGKASREQRTYAQALRPFAKVCAWTEGQWDFGPDQKRRWNAVQNTHKDIQWLATNLLAHYRKGVRRG